MALKDWKRIKGGWKKGLTELSLNEVHLDNGKILYGISIVDDRGWTSEHLRNVPIGNTTDKQKIMKQIKDYMRSH